MLLAIPQVRLQVEQSLPHVVCGKQLSGCHIAVVVFARVSTDSAAANIEQKNFRTLNAACRKPYFRSDQALESWACGEVLDQQSDLKCADPNAIMEEASLENGFRFHRWSVVI